jgi:hypothetical protein
MAAVGSFCVFAFGWRPTSELMRAKVDRSSLALERKQRRADDRGFVFANRAVCQRLSAPVSACQRRAALCHPAANIPEDPFGDRRAERERATHVPEHVSPMCPVTPSLGEKADARSLHSDLHRHPKRYRTFAAETSFFPTELLW